MSEQTPREVQKNSTSQTEKQPLYKRIARRVSPFVVAALTLLTPADKAPLPITQTTDPNPRSEAADIIKPPEDPKTQQETKEQLKVIPGNTVVIDMAPTTATEGIHQQQFVTEQEFLKSILQKDYIDEAALASKYGSGFKKAVPDEMLQDDPKSALLYGFLQKDKYIEHGVNVAATMQETLKKVGFTTEVEMLPLQNLIDESRVSFYTDDLGNKHFIFAISAEKVIDTLKKYPDQKIVNMSFEFGDVDVGLWEFSMQPPMRDPHITSVNVTYRLDTDGSPLYYIDYDYTKTDFELDIFRNSKGEEIKPVKEITPQMREEIDKESKRRFQEVPFGEEVITRNYPPGIGIKGGYAKEKAAKSLEELYKVCREFPDKLFIAAAGNGGEDLREALKTMQNIPTNLILVAQWGSEWISDDYPTGSVYGAQLYIPNKKLGIPDGSSFSTPYVSAYANLLYEKGYSIDEIRKRIMGAGEIREYTDYDNGINQALVFNPSLLD